ncbi:MAG: hypothetical protein QOI13_3665 [Paraburkholderia sp.]|nr:hypothetical protein [Paraburkholderia sp.]
MHRGCLGRWIFHGVFRRAKLGAGGVTPRTADSGKPGPLRRVRLDCAQRCLHARGQRNGGAGGRSRSRRALRRSVSGIRRWHSAGRAPLGDRRGLRTRPRLLNWLELRTRLRPITRLAMRTRPGLFKWLAMRTRPGLLRRLELQRRRRLRCQRCRLRGRLRGRSGALLRWRGRGRLFRRARRHRGGPSRPSVGPRQCHCGLGRLRRAPRRRRLGVRVRGGGVGCFRAERVAREGGRLPACRPCIAADRLPRHRVDGCGARRARAGRPRMRIVISYGGLRAWTARLTRTGPLRA